MGGFGRLIHGLAQADIGYETGKRAGEDDKAKRLRQAQRDMMDDSLKTATIGHLDAQTKALGMPRVTPKRALEHVKGEDGKMYVFDPETGKLTLAEGQQPGPPANPPAPGVGTPGWLKAHIDLATALAAVKPASDAQNAAAGQADEAAKALEQMADIEKRNPSAANKAAGIASSAAFGKVGNMVGEARNMLSGDPDTQMYYNANQQWRLAIASLRGQRGSQYLQDLERRATTRAVNETSQARDQRLGAQQAIIDELRKKAGKAATPLAKPKPSATPARPAAGPAKAAPAVNPRFWSGDDDE